MKNFDYIKSLNQEEFTEYIDAVFIAGRMYELKMSGEMGKFSDNDFDLIDYEDWLHKEKQY